MSSRRVSFGILALTTSSLLSYGPAWAIRAEHHAPDEASTADTTQIDVQETTASESEILNPLSKAWKAARAKEIELYSQNIAQPHGGGSVGQVHVSGLQTSSGLAIRLQWHDETKDDASGGSNLKDAAAVQFPVAQNASLMMGHPEKPVSIWHWLAARQATPKANSKPAYRPLDTKQVSKSDMQSCVEELIAAGHDNKAPQPDHLKSLYGNAVWSNGSWALVIFKSNRSGSDSSPVFNNLHKLPVAFAIWNGSAGESHGQKSISNWATLHYVQK